MGLGDKGAAAFANAIVFNHKVQGVGRTCSSILFLNTFVYS